MGRILPLLSLCVITLGCTKSPPAEMADVEHGEAVPVATDEKALLQQYLGSLIERTLGGDPTAKQKLLGVKDISITRIDGLSLESVVQKYGSSGDPIPGWYQFRLQAQGYDGVGTRFDKGEFNRVLAFTAIANTDDESGWLIRYDGSPSD